MEHEPVLWIPGALLTPRISLVGLKPAVRHCVLHRQLGARWGVKRVGTGRGVLGGYTGRMLYRVPSHPRSTLVLPGPNQWYIAGSTVSLGTPRPCRPLRTPSSRTRTQLQYGRDSATNILKLVIISECRLKSAMRPAIVPVSRTGSISHDLDFLRFP